MERSIRTWRAAQNWTEHFAQVPLCERTATHLINAHLSESHPVLEESITYSDLFQYTIMLLIKNVCLISNLNLLQFPAIAFICAFFLSEFRALQYLPFPLHEKTVDFFWMGYISACRNTEYHIPISWDQHLDKVFKNVHVSVEMCPG